jgi:hypothetical protein
MTKYKPTKQEQVMSMNIDNLVHAMLRGEVSAIGFCAQHIDGNMSFFYLNKPDHAALRAPLNKLMGLYEGNRQFARTAAPKVTAPSANRSYRSH